MGVKVLDSEVYRNYYLVMLRDVDSGAVEHFELYDGHSLDGDALRRELRENTIVTFNGAHYDVPLLTLALHGASASELKDASDAIIFGNLRSWQFERQYGVKIARSIDHIDMIEVAPGVASLKIYGGRLHCPKLQDLPIDPDELISPEQRQELRTYCANDLELSLALYRHLLPQIELRRQMSARYGGIDLRSKSDAQVAEAVITYDVEKAQGHPVGKPGKAENFRYERPAFIEFSTAPLREVAELISRIEFAVPSTGSVVMPKELADLKISIGAGVYRMGIGGLHSSEKCSAHKADDTTVLVDRDVASYYPEIILRTGLAPAHMGEAFTRTYRTIVQRRIEAKRAGDKVTADSLKIVVNGTFGKFGSKWSKLYAPKLMIQTTITGQLALLLLIETLEAEGIPVVSANTDGAVIKCPFQKIPMMEFIVWEWEKVTGFETEATEYSAIYSRDVNNYIAVKKGGGVKLKGAYAPPLQVANSWPSPSNEICTGAVVKYLTDGTPVEQTIHECRDVRKFVTLRQVKGGATKDGAYLGKAVRWYYSIAAAGPIQYKINGYTVPRSDGAAPLMQLPDELPGDLDFDWYIGEAKSILKDIGAMTC